MADFDDVLKLALKLLSLVDDLEGAEVGDAVDLPPIKAKIGKERWRLETKAVREK